MKRFCYWLLASLALPVIAADEVATAVIEENNLVIDIPRVELTSAEGTSAYAVQLTAPQGQGHFALSKLEALPAPRFRVVTLYTNFGNIKLELDSAKAPLSVANFIRYVQEGFYSNTIFHRVINDFMIQGGAFSPDFTYNEPHDQIYNEANNGLKNLRGAIAMARTSDPHSANSQFYINLADNSFLDFPGSDTWGYTVFGKVTEGMEVVDKIKVIPTGSGGPFSTDVPQSTVIVEKAVLVQ